MLLQNITIIFLTKYLTMGNDEGVYQKVVPFTTGSIYDTTKK